LTSVTCGAGTAHPYEAPVFYWVRVVRSLVFYVMFCRSLFVLLLLAIVLSILYY